MRAAGLGIVCVLAGCAQISGLADLGVCDGACTDATVDAPLEAAADGGDASTDAKSDVGPPKVDGGDGGDAGSVSSCNKPSDCSQASSVCCLTMMLTGTIPQCSIVSEQSQCEAPLSCTTQVAQSCTSDRFRRCVVATDCSEVNYPKCCTIPFGDSGTRMVCATSTIAAAAGGSCL